MNRHQLLFPVALLLACALSVSCGDEEQAGDVTLNFLHVVAESPLTLNSVDYINAAGERYSVSRLEYLLTAVSLVRANGTTVDLLDVLYINAEDATTGRVVASRVPGGDYRTLSFRFGVPPGSEFGDLPNRLELNQMEWPAPMGGGYHYMRLEGLVDGGVESLLSHLGPSRGADYSFVVDLPIDLFVDDAGARIDVLMDLNQWWEPTIYAFAGRGMIMGNPDAQATLSANGAGVFSAVVR